MKKTVRLLWCVGVLALFVSVGMSLNAQTSQAPQQDPQSQQPTQQAPPDQAPDQSSQAPDSQADSSQAAGVQTFTGVIVKSGSKYMFQDAATGSSYDIDHQDEVQKFEGKKVTVHGTLDPKSKMIHIH